MPDKYHGWKFQALPRVPGLYWNTVMDSCSNWSTDLVHASVETRPDQSKIVRMTDLTLGFVLNAQDVRVQKEVVARGQKHEHRLMNSYWQGPLTLPDWPTQPKDEIEVPKVPGLYFYVYFGSGDHLWHSELNLVTIHRYFTSATETTDIVYSLSLPGFQRRTVGKVMNACWMGPYDLPIPTVLPGGSKLIYPITKSGNW